MSTSVRYDDATLADIQRRFREGRPRESAKRKRHSRCSLIASLRTEIEQFLNEGYSLEGIAEYFAALDVHIPAGTLKNYLGRARRSPAGTQALPAHKTQRDSVPESDRPRRKSRQSGSDDGTRKKAPGAHRSSTNQDQPGGAARETARDGQSTDRPVHAESRGMNVHPAQSGDGGVVETPAHRGEHVDDHPMGVAPGALGDTPGVRPTNATTPNGGHGVMRGDGESARVELAAGNAAAPTPTHTVDASTRAPASPAAREPTITLPKGAARPPAHAVGIGNIGFVPRR